MLCETLYARFTGSSVSRVLAAMATCAAAVCALGLLSSPASAQWTSWGGPRADFSADCSGLKTEWPESGPKKLWSRALGEGYSAVLVDGDRLYTMYRGESKERVVCLDAKSGETRWEHAYDSDPAPGHVSEFGDGPRATPLISGDRIYTIGVSGSMHCLDKNSGKVHWSKELWKDLGGTVLNHGYSSSPIEYKDTVIVLVGGNGHGIVAFKKEDGAVAWQGTDFDNSFSTPRIYKLRGEDQLITFMAREVAGVDPSSGRLLWSFPHENQWRQNISMPVLIEDVLFISSPEAGARGLKLSRKGEGFDVEEVWSNRKVQFYHVTTVEAGGFVYGCSGGQAPHFMMGVNHKTGELAWRERGFSKANTILADGWLLILDEDGNLALATARPDGLTVHAKVDVVEGVAWTVPTLVGKTLYVRDKKSVSAYDMG
jgi:outer membrane protein assembly factor BamB